MKKVYIKGTIVSNDVKWAYDFYGIESVCPNDVTAALAEANGDDVTVEINSGGGEVFAGSEMYYSILNYSGNVTIDIVGFCGSAASVIAMAGHCRMVPSGLFMIHNVSGYAEGDYREMEHTSNVLKTCNRAIAKAYRVKTGMGESELLGLMNKAKWMFADEVTEMGFVDEIIGDDEQKQVILYNAEFATILKPDIIAKTREFMAAGKPPPEPPPTDDGAAEITALKNQFEII